MNKAEVTEFFNNIKEKEWVVYPPGKRFHLSKYQNFIYFQIPDVLGAPSLKDYTFKDLDRIAIRVGNEYYITNANITIRYYLFSLGFPLVNPLVKLLL